MTKVTIVIVNWRTPLLLRRCLQAIAKDDQAASFEVYVVDNASADQSLSILANEFSYVKVIANDTNTGFSKACNQAIPQALGEYVLLLNPDTIVVESAISKLASFLDNHAKCGAVGPKILNDDGTLQLACRLAFPSLAASFFRLTYLSKLLPKHPLIAKYNMTYSDPSLESEVDALSGSCMMVRKSIIDKIGLLDENIFMFGEDIDWCWRVKEAGWQVYYYPEAVIYHSHGAASRLRPIGTTFDLHKGMAVFYGKHIAPKHWPIFNWMVYALIWLRAILFVAVNLVKSQIKIPAKQNFSDIPVEKL